MTSQGSCRLVEAVALQIGRVPGQFAGRQLTPSGEFQQPAGSVLSHSNKMGCPSVQRNKAALVEEQRSLDLTS